jgi:DNA-binding NarL/FixJ family response regulator
MGSIKLAIIDDYPVFLHVLTDVLSSFSEFQVVISTGSFKDYLQQLDDEDPDIILMDSSVFLSLRDQVREGFLNYISSKTLVIMGFEVPSEMNTYRRLHPNIQFLWKDSELHFIVHKLTGQIKEPDSFPWADFE